MEKESRNSEKDERVVSDWRKKITGREEIIKYLKASERYWYSDDWFGSEKRKNPA